MIVDHKADSLLELLKTVYSFCIGVCVWLWLWLRLPLACNQFYDDFVFGIIASIMLSVYMDLNVLCYFWYIRNARDYWFDNTINVSMTITWISVRMIISVGIYHFRFLHQYEIYFKFPILRPIVYPFSWQQPNCWSDVFFYTHTQKCTNQSQNCHILHWFCRDSCSFFPLNTVDKDFWSYAFWIDAIFPLPNW